MLFKDRAFFTPLALFFIFLTAFRFHILKFNYIAIENQYQLNISENKKPHLKWGSYYKCMKNIFLSFN